MICALLNSNSNIPLYKTLLCFFSKQQRCLNIKNHPVKPKMTFLAKVQANMDDIPKNNSSGIIKLSTLYILSPNPWFFFVHSPSFCPSNPCVGGPDKEHLLQSDWQTLSLAVTTISCAFLCRWWTEGNSTEEQTVYSYCQTLKSRSPHKRIT